MIFILVGLVGLGIGEARAEDKVDFARDIQPILQKSCVECHGAEKAKGKLRLDNKEAAFKPGKDVTAIVPGKANKSDVYRRITLPADSDDVMPNKGDLLTKAQTDLVRDWINQGAAWPEGLVIASGGKKADSASEPGSTTPQLPDFKPTAAEVKAIKELAALGVDVRPIAVNLDWREVNFRGQSPEAIEKALVPLRQVLGLVEVNLGGAKIKDADLANLQGLINLNRLHLENTPITDAGLAHLKGLVNLSYLNLYGTAVTDAGLEDLKGLSRLKHLYLWQTKTTEAGVSDLKKALPNVDISTGAELKESAKEDSKKEEPKKAEEKKPEVKKEEKKPEEEKDLAALAGKWVAKVSDSQGQSFKQVLTIKKNKFTFEAVRDGGQTMLYAEGEVKVEDQGPFKAAKFYNIQGGSSASDLQSVDDDRTVIYTLGDNEITVAANFDKQRAEPPTVTRYVKTAPTAEAKTLVIDKIVMHKTPQSAEYFMCFDVTVGEAKKRFNVPDKAYDKDELTIAMDLSIPNVRKGAICKFVMKLDDVAGDECSEEMDNRSDGSFTVSDNGSQDFKPEGQWSYSIYWHLK